MCVLCVVGQLYGMRLALARLLAVLVAGVKLFSMRVTVMKDWDEEKKVSSAFSASILVSDVQNSEVKAHF